MATLQPELDMANALAAALSMTVGTEIKLGSVKSPTMPGNAATVIWLSPYSGQFEPYLDTANQGGRYTSRVQATVLGPPNDEEAGLALARQVRDAINRKHPASPAGYVYWLLVPGSGEPFPGGFNESNQPKYTVNFEAQWSAVL